MSLPFDKIYQFASTVSHNNINNEVIRSVSPCLLDKLLSDEEKNPEEEEAPISTNGFCTVMRSAGALDDPNFLHEKDAENEKGSHKTATGSTSPTANHIEASDASKNHKNFKSGSKQKSKGSSQSKDEPTSELSNKKSKNSKSEAKHSNNTLKPESKYSAKQSKPETKKNVKQISLAKSDTDAVIDNKGINPVNSTKDSKGEDTVVNELTGPGNCADTSSPSEEPSRVKSFITDILNSTTVYLNEKSGESSLVNGIVNFMNNSLASLKKQSEGTTPSPSDEILLGDSASNITTSASLTPKPTTTTTAENEAIIDKPPFQPAYSTRVYGALQKEDDVLFFVNTTKRDDPEPILICRTHEDFVNLLNILKNEKSTSGVIFPPLPPSPELLEEPSKRPQQIQIGDYTGFRVGDFEENCIGYTIFLTLCLAKPVLKDSKPLMHFILEKVPPPAYEVSTGFFTNLAKALDDYRTMGYYDPDEYFHTLLFRNVDLAKCGGEALTQSRDLIEKKRLLSDAYEVLKRRLMSMDTPGDKFTPSRWFQVFFQSVMVARDVSDLQAANLQRFLCTMLTFHSSFATSQQFTLQQRIHKLMELDKAIRKFERHDPPRKQDAIRLENERKTVYVLTERCKKQFGFYDLQRERIIKNSLSVLAKNEISIARESLTVLRKLYADAKSMKF